MPRQANQSVPLSWGIALAMVIVIAGGSLYLLRSFLSDPYRGIPDLPLQEYVEGSLSFRGNVYKIDGRVENQLGWSEKAGRLFSFAFDSEGKIFHVGVLFPSDLNQTNIQKGQNFQIKVKVVEKGLLQAVQIRKV